MTTLDEQMAEIERLAALEPLPIDATGWHCTDSLGYDEDMSYLVTCANAAPALVAEVRRLREEVERLEERVDDTRSDLFWARLKNEPEANQ